MYSAICDALALAAPLQFQVLGWIVTSKKSVSPWQQFQSSQMYTNSLQHAMPD